jgi:GNAT superfamily N-acetyltransferase
MRKSWATAEPPTATVPASVRIRALSKADEPALGRLMWLAFHDSLDDQYSAPADADADIAEALAGKWGPVVWQASVAAELDSSAISAVIIVLDNAHQDLPLLAFAITDPAWQRRRIGQRLIEESIHRLDGAGVKELHLAVTRGNPAFALYQRLGFEVLLNARSLLSGLAVGEFADDVEVADVAGVLLEQVEQDPLECRRIGSVPPVAGLADVSKADS